jgi:DNA-binding transcriptional MerR regulator
VSNDQPAGVDSLGEGWLTIAEAAEALEVSAKTIRRRLKAGEITGELVHDPKIGAERWMIDGSTLPTAPGVALIPVELLDRLEDAWRQAREASAEAAVAELRADFETDRRQRTEARLETSEGDRDRLAREVTRLRGRHQAEMSRRWWRRRDRR